MSHRRPRRVLIWSPFGAGPHYWGPGQNAWRLVRHMRERYGNEFVFELAHGFEGQQKVEPFTRIHYIAPLVNGNLVSLRSFLAVSKRWLSAHARDYDVFHSVSSYDPGLVPASWFRRYHSQAKAFTRIATRGEGLWPGSLRSRVLRRHAVRRRKARSLSGVIALSRDIRADLEKIRRMPPCEEIPNGVDTEYFTPATEAEKREARERLGLEDVFTVLFVGSISERKQPHLLVEALRVLPPEPRAVQLVLAGPVREGNAEASNIEALLAANPDLRRRVYMVGFREDTRSLYRAADVFALPSKKEGMSNALLEAQSSGLPSIVTGISGSSDVVVHGSNGYIAPADAGIIAEHIARLATDASALQRMSGESRACIQRHYSLDSVAERYRTLWQA